MEHNQCNQALIHWDLLQLKWTSMYPFHHHPNQMWGKQSTRKGSPVSH